MTFEEIKILSWNINGLRALKTNFKEVLDDLNADIICLQETKITRDQLEESLTLVDGYHSFFSFSRKRSGYSGVATFCKKHCTPAFAQEGLSGILKVGYLKEKYELVNWDSKDLRDLDAEGRCIVTQHPFMDKNGSAKFITIFNVYCPRADPERPERGIFKLSFYELLRESATAVSKSGSHVIILGDLNTCHKRIDHCDPGNDEEFDCRSDRIFMNKFIYEVSQCLRRVKYETKEKTEEKLPNGVCTEVNISSKGFSENHSPGESSDVIQESGEEDDKKPFVENVGCSGNGKDNVALLRRPSPDDNSLLESKRTSLDVVESSLHQPGEESQKDCFDADESGACGPKFRVVDTFRVFYPDRVGAFTCWNTKVNARATNYGTRIDYVLCDADLLPWVRNSEIHPDIMGSDHCPVSVTLSGLTLFDSGYNLPSICTKYYPEFIGSQQKLSSYFKSFSSREEADCGTRRRPNDDVGASKRKLKPGDAAGRTKKKHAVGKQATLESYFYKDSSSPTSSNSETVLSSQDSLTESDTTMISSSSENSKNTLAFSDKENECEKKTIQSELAKGKNLDCPDISRTEEMRQDTQDTRNTERICGIPDTAEPRSCASMDPLPSVGPQKPKRVEGQPLGSDFKPNGHSNSWGFLMKKREPPPLCTGHKEPAVLRTVKKKGPTWNKQFYSCARGVGKEGDPNSRCNFFKWLNKPR